MIRRIVHSTRKVARAGGWVVALVGTVGAARAATVSWKECLRQKPEWYAGAEAARITETVLLAQRECGGWPKNADWAKALTESVRTRLRKDKVDRENATFDNGATYTEVRFLAKVHGATSNAAVREAVLHGIDFVLAAQYPNGGWPQFPFKRGYYQRITFNDGAMVGAMSLLRDVGRADAGFGFVDPDRRARAAAAVRRGIDCMLLCQVVVGGRRTAWCAQHDEKTLAPVPARSYELASLSGGESVGIVRFLMQEPSPSPAVREAIEAAVAWFGKVRIAGVRVEERRDPSQPGGKDKVVVPDLTAGPLWARFYEIGTDRPFFCGRDGVKKYSMAEIEHERRTGYAWYTDAAAGLLATDYPAWKAAVERGKTP